MADRTIVITVVGPEEVIAPALEAFVRFHGWDEGSELTQLEKARLVLRQFMIDGVKAYSTIQAESAARLQAATQADATLDLTTLTVDLV